MRKPTGSASGGKGMVLLPRRVGGRYAMLDRHDSKSVWNLLSDDIHLLGERHEGLDSAHPCEFVQVGNCGWPIEIDEGWLALTRSVGTVRNFCIGACLLDKDDPSKLLARIPHERDG